MRKPILAAGLALVVAVLVVLALPMLINIDQHRGAIQAEMEKKLNRPVTLGALSLRIFPLSIRMADVTIAEAPALRSTRPFASAKEVYASAGLFALLRKDVSISALRLTQPQIELVRDARGAWNFATLGGSSSGGSEISLRDFRIEDGQIAITDLAAHQPRTLYDHIDLRLSDYAPGKSFGVVLAAHLPGAGKELLSFKGTAGPLRSDNSTAFPVDGHITMKEVAISDLQKLTGGSAPSVVEGIASGDADLRSDGPAVTLRGTASLDKVIARGAALGYPIHVDLDVREDPASNRVTINRADIQFGRTPLSLSGTIGLPRPNSPSSPSDLSIKTSDAPVAGILSLANAYGVSAVQGVTGSGSISIDLRITGAIDRPGGPDCSGSASLTNATLHFPTMAKPLDIKNASFRFQRDSATLENLIASIAGSNIRGRLTLRDFAAPQVQFDLSADKLNVADLQPAAATTPAHPSRAMEKISGSGTISAGTLIDSGMILTNARANCVLDHGVIRLSPVTAGLFGGTENGTITIDTRPARPIYTLNSKIDHVDAEKLLSAATSLKQTLYGLLAANGNASFVSAPDGNIARSLNGDITVNISNGKLMNVNILNELASVGSFSGARRQAESFTSIKQLSGTLSIRNGVARTNNLRALLDVGSLAASGSVNLIDQALDLHMTAVLGREFSQIAGGTQVGGYLKTVLANNNGELVVPVLVTGTMAKPRFAPDVQQMAQMRLQNLLPTAGNPGQLTTGLLGSVLGGKGGKSGVGSILNSITGQNGNGAQQQSDNPIGGILDSFRKKKPNQK